MENKTLFIRSPILNKMFTMGASTWGHNSQKMCNMHENVAAGVKIPSTVYYYVILSKCENLVSPPSATPYPIQARNNIKRTCIAYL